MKKASLIALIFVCFAFAFTIPSVSANRGTMESRGNVDLTPDMNGNNLANDFNRGVKRVENDVNRARNDVNRAANRIENNMSRTFGVRDYDGYNTNLTRTNNVTNPNYRTTAATTPNRGISWGWLGLLGLLGLAGMRSRDRNRA